MLVPNLAVGLICTYKGTKLISEMYSGSSFVHLKGSCFQGARQELKELLYSELGTYTSSGATLSKSYQIKMAIIREKNRILLFVIGNNSGKYSLKTETNIY